MFRNQSVGLPTLPANPPVSALPENPPSVDPLLVTPAQAFISQALRKIMEPQSEEQAPVATSIHTLAQAERAPEPHPSDETVHPLDGTALQFGLAIVTLKKTKGMRVEEHNSTTMRIHALAEEAAASCPGNVPVDPTNPKFLLALGALIMTKNAQAEEKKRAETKIYTEAQVEGAPKSHSDDATIKPMDATDLAYLFAFVHNRQSRAAAKMRVEGR